MFVCMCVQQRERGRRKTERKGDRESEREQERERERDTESAYIYEYIHIQYCDIRSSLILCPSKNKIRDHNPFLISHFFVSF